MLSARDWLGAFYPVPGGYGLGRRSRDYCYYPFNKREAASPIKGPIPVPPNGPSVQPTNMPTQVSVRGGLKVVGCTWSKDRLLAGLILLAVA